MTATPDDTDVFVDAIPEGAPVVVVLVEQEGCGHCEEYHPVFVKVAKEFAHEIPIVRLDAATQDPLAQRWMNFYKVEATPTVIVASRKRGQIWRLEGSQPEFATRHMLGMARVHAANEAAMPWWRR